MVANRTILVNEKGNVNNIDEVATRGVLHAGLRGWKRQTIDPLHLIRIMPAQGYGCRQKLRLDWLYAYEPTFSCTGDGGLFAFGMTRTNTVRREKHE